MFTRQVLEQSRLLAYGSCVSLVFMRYQPEMSAVAMPILVLSCGFTTYSLEVGHPLPSIILSCTSNFLLHDALSLNNDITSC